MNTINKEKLTLLSSEIRTFELQRADLKETLVSIENKKSKLLQDLEVVEAQIENDVLTGEKSAELKNDKARKAAVKAALIADHDYMKITERVEMLVQEIKETELTLRKNLIEINFLTRAFQIELPSFQVQGDN